MERRGVAQAKDFVVRSNASAIISQTLRGKKEKGKKGKEKLTAACYRGGEG